MIIKACPGHPLLLGRLGENLAREIVFVDEVAAWLSEYPNAAIGLLNQRPGDTQGYPVARAVVSGGALHWTVTNTDLSADGNGRCELVATDNGVVVKSAIYDTIILTALDGSGETPEPWEDWREYFVGLKDEAEAAAETAQISASESLGRADAALQYSLNASQSANNAAGSAHEASRYAVEAEHIARDVQHDAENAEFSARSAADSSREAQTASASARSAATAAAESAAQITGLTAAAETLPEGSDATAQYDAQTGVLRLGIPRGETGAAGPQGDPGEDYVLTAEDKAEIAGMVNVPVTDVQVNGSSVVAEGVASIEMPVSRSWELIREDTVTNDTEADIIINADSNGQAIELTDVRLVLVSPQQDAAFSKADYGRVRCYYQTGEYDIIFIGAYTQAANASAKVSYVAFEQSDGMLVKSVMPNTTRGGMGPLQTYATEDGEGHFVLTDMPRVYSKINITKVTGTLHYILYGKRKVV